MAIGSSSTSSSSLANAAASASSSSRTPLSIEDLLAKQKADKETASKPKFLTKQQRAELALARRKEETEAQLARQESEKQERERLEVAARQVATSHAGAGTGAGVGMVNGGGRAHNQQGGGQGGYGAQQGRYGNGNNAGQGYGNQGGYGGQGGYGANNSGGGRSNIARPYGNQGPVTNQQHQPPSAPRGPSSQRGPPTGPRGQYASSPLSQSAAPVAGTPTGPRTADSNGYNGGHTINGNGSTPDSAVPPTDSELDAIRARYLGASTMAALNPTQGPKKPRARKLQDKKFVFDWDASDDTSSAEVGTWRETLTRGEDMGGSLNGGPGGGVAGGGTMFGGRLAGFDEGGRRRGVNSGADDKMADSLERRRAGRHGIDERHWTEKPLEEMKDRDWRIFREDFSISTKGGKIPHPLRSWTESAIPPTILQVIEEIGYKDPSPIQRQAIPIGLQNRDLVGIAQTGSGKTAAFVIPMLDYIGHLEPLTDENRHLGPYALILAPTRELAQQIENETKRFATPLGYKTVSIVGGRSVDEQQYALRDGAEIVIATPGRLKDILDRSILVLSQCRYVVMDEADRMVDLGFELDLTAILDAMPADSIKPEGIDASMALSDEEAKWKYRVTTLFSATMPPVVERLTKKYLRSAATVIIGNAGEAVDTVEQRVEFVQGPDKRKTRLQEILRTIGLPPPMIVFVNEKKTADQVVKFVQAAGRRGITLHSGKNQEQREAALQALRDGEVEVLVATDLAGRGIDVPDVTCVINWQMASTIEKYVHRIGRTGRAGKQGIAITFLGNEDEETMYDLKQEISKSPISQMNPELAHHQAAKQRITREMKRKRDEDE